jgi:regulator of sigma E protease
MEWILAILAIGALIVVHEAGHYVVARLCGMRVERFSIGFGPAIASWRSKKTGTQFQIAPIPFGGFVEIKGMNILEEVDPSDASAYPNRPAWQRFVTIFAGPATNYVFAVVLAFLLFATAGLQHEKFTSTTKEVTAGSAAEGILKPGDVFVAVDGTTIDMPLADAVRAAGEGPAVWTVLRDGKRIDLTMTPRRDESGNLRLGVMVDQSYHVQREDVGVARAAKEAVVYPVVATKGILKGLYEWIVGKQEGRVSSVVGITEEVKKRIEAGWVVALGFVMMLNVYLGLFNLFPLPALDGGRLVFLGYEMVTRRRANPKLEATVHMVGVLVLAVLLVVVTVNDCRHLGS